MKKSFLLLICTLLLANFLYAQPNLSGKKIYVDPGHGSYGLNDRPQSTIPYPFKYSYTNSNGTSWIPDTAGFFETNTNLWKCLYLGEKLKKAGATVVYSHTKAGPNPYPYIEDGKFDWVNYQKNPDFRAYYREPKSIRQEVGENYNDFDYFISVHSNAPNDKGDYNDDALSCYPMFLYRGYNNGDDNDKNYTDAQTSTYNSESYEMANTTWRYCYELLEGVGSLRHPFEGETADIENKLIFGDRDYYYYDPENLCNETFGGINYVSWLGVICHGVPGFLSEGYHHSYGPARHRALNRDYCNMEGLAYFRGIRDYFGAEDETVGYICGVIKDNTTKMFDHPDYQYHPDSHDQWMPCNGAVVVLKDADGKEIKYYTCDKNYNGIFVFYDLEPGTYTLESEYNGLTFSETVEVLADETTYTRLYPTVTPHICAYDLNVEQIGDSYTFSFYANSNAERAKIVFYNNEKQEIGSHPITVVKGNNSITLFSFNLPDDAGETLSWAVELEGKNIEEFALVHSDNSLDIYTTSQLFNAVNTNPMSENFGQIYVMHRANTNTNNAAQAAESGLFVYDFELARQNNAAYQGDVTWKHPTRMSIDSEGYLYISDWSSGNSGIHVANTADLSQSFTQFYAGTRDANGKFTYNRISTGSATSGNYIYGTGKDTKLYVCDEKNAGNGIAIYNIGQEDGAILRRWEKIADKIITYDGTTAGNSAVWATSKGVFISQHRNQHDEYPELQFYNNDGECVFTSKDNSNFDGAYGGGFVVSSDEEMLIFNSGVSSKQFKVFTITWNDNTPTLTLSSTYTHNLDAIRQMNWDYAGNLVCSGDDGIHIFTVPTNDNTTLVPARATITKEQSQLDPATQRIWAFDLKHKATMAGYQFTFKSVENGVGSLTLKDEQGEALKSFYISSVTQGENTFTIPYDDMPQTREDLSWEITLAAGAVQNVADVTPNGIEEYYFPQGVATNNNPESEHFGKIYMLDAYGKENTSGLTEEAGIYVYDALLQLENNYQDAYLPQGVVVDQFATGRKYRVLHRIAVNPITNEVAFVQCKTSHLWIADPSDLNGEAINIGSDTYASSLCYDADGALYIFGYEEQEDINDDNHTNTAIIHKKKGNELEEFTQIPDWYSANERNSMASDGRGGLWVVSKWAGNEVPIGNFFHLNTNGELDYHIKITKDYNNIVSQNIVLPTHSNLPDGMPTNFYRGQLAYDAQRDILALGGNAKVTLFKVTYNQSGVPTLEYWQETPSLGDDTKAIDGIAFDYAGDLIVASATTGFLYKYGLPTTNNVCTTPAPTSQIIPYRFVLQDTKHNQTALNNIMEQTVNTLVCRSLTAGMYNTLCLPFALDAFDDTPLEGAEVLKYSDSEELDGDILLYFDAVTNMEAGVPYLIEPQVDIQGPIDFTNVTIAVSEGSNTGNGITFNGILSPKELTGGDKSILFLVSDNKLAWANATANMKGMRAYFSLPEGEYDKLRTRARIVTSESTTTDIQQTTTTSTNAQKLIRNGMLYILKDGQLYTVFGTKVK